MPRWYWWVAGVLAVRTVWENLSGAAAGVLAASLLGGLWVYRLCTAPHTGEARWRAAWRELRRIASEVGEAVLGWLVIILLLLALVGVIVTWPPSWKLVLIAVVLAIAAIAVLIASVVGLSNAVDRVRLRRWVARRDELGTALTAWTKNALSVEPVDRELVELTIRAVYRRRRGLEPPAVRWASSPPEFARLLAEADERPRLHGPPPSWFALLPPDFDWWIWHSIWSHVEGELPVPDLEAALVAASGTEGLGRLVEQATWFAFRTGVAIILERPTELHFADGELHNPYGAAARFPDGWAVWALRGVAVPAAIEDPDSLDLRAALTHENLEVRRVLVDHLGWDRVVRGSGLTPHAQDGHGRLWRLAVPGEEPILLLEVENATPEPDGRRRPYFLRVPPDMRSPREATAWTFGLPELEYAPEVES